MQIGILIPLFLSRYDTRLPFSFSSPFGPPVPPCDTTYAFIIQFDVYLLLRRYSYPQLFVLVLVLVVAGGPCVHDHEGATMVMATPLFVLWCHHGPGPLCRFILGVLIDGWLTMN